MDKSNDSNIEVITIDSDEDSHHNRDDDNDRLSSDEDINHTTNDSELLSDLDEVPETPQTTPSLMSDFDNSDSDDRSSDTVLCHDLNRMPDCSLPLPPPKPDNHTFLFVEIPLRQNCVPKPHPRQYKDIWDSRNHVKMPCSPQNQILAMEHCSRAHVSKWALIRETLYQTKIKSSQDLVKTIKNYNPMMSKFNFNCLRSVLNELESNDDYHNNIFDQFFPQLIELTLLLPSIVTKSINLLKHNTNATIFLSQYQIASLMANAFFCTYPKRSQTSGEYKHYPSINFISLFTNENQSEYPTVKVEKLKCIINYFRRVMKDTPKGIVSFERRCLADEEVPDWSHSRKKLCKLNVCSDGLIERDGTGMIQVDFANKFVGGGVLTSGSVQEEIRFVICPELIISRLFTEKLEDNEVLIVKGCEQYSDYSGYGNSFVWKENFVDNTPVDEWGRRYTTVVVMDALYFNNDQKNMQYGIEFVERELTKAYCGFYERTHCDHSNKCAIASGNWGCGAFNGDPQLKAIIQLMAASQSDRDLLLFTFNDVDLKLKLQQFHRFVVRNEFTVSDLYSALNDYNDYMTNSKIIHKLDVIDYIMQFKDITYDTNIY